MAAVIGALRVVLGIDTSAFSEGLKKAQTGLKSAGQSLQSLGQSMSLGLTAPLTVAGGLIMKTAGDFEASMNRVQAALSASSDEMSALSGLARELGKSTTFSAGEAADAIEMLAKNGLSTSEILGGALKASLDLAASSGAELAGAADLATDIMANFRKESSDLGGVVDGVAGVLLQSKFGFDDYRLALAQAGGVAGGLGVTLDEFNAVIAATSGSFASGSDAGTSFKTFLQRLVPASVSAAEAMEALGLDFFEADGQMKSMAAVAQELQDSLSGLSDEDKSAALSTIFGADATRTAISLMEAGAQGVRDLDAAISSASATEQAAARTKGWAGALEELSGAFDELRLAIASSGMLETLTTFVQCLTGIVDRLSGANPALLRFSTIVAGVGVVLGPLVVGLGLFLTAIASISAPVLAVVAGIAALVAGLVALSPQIALAKDEIVRFGSEAVAWLGAKFNELVATIVGMKEQFAQAGRDVVAGLLSGLQEAWSSVTGWMKSSAQGMVDSVKDALGIHSPSRVFADIGRDTMLGLDQGIRSSQGMVQDNIENFSRSVASSLQGILTGATNWQDAMNGLLQGTLNNLSNSMISSGISGAFGLAGIPGFARGTNFAPGGLAIVGERGPELVNLPRGAKVTPNHRIGAAGDASSVQISLAPGLIGGVLKQAEGQSVRISRAGAQDAIRNSPRAVRDAERRGIA